MDKIEFRIVDSDNNIEGVLDVGDSEKFPFTINDSISDITTLNKRSGSFSSSFDIPSTKNNDNFLEHLYLSSHKNYKDFDAELPAELVINGINIDRGKLRLKSTITKEYKRRYKGVFFGNSMEWVKDLDKLTMSDLSYLDTTFSYNNTVVENSWVNNGGNDDVVFALINRGKRVYSNQTTALDFYPDYFLIDVLNNAFKEVGYNFESDFFNSSRNRNLIIPHFGKNFRFTESQKDNARFNAQLDSSITYLDNSWSYGGGWTEGYLNIDDTSTILYNETPLPLFDNGNNFNGSLGEYVVPFNGYYKFTADLDYTLNQSGGYLFNIDFQLFVEIERSSVIQQFNSNHIMCDVLENGGSTNGSSNYFRLDTNDIIRFKYRFKGYNGNVNSTPPTNIEFTITNLGIRGDLANQLTFNSPFNWKDVSDDEVNLLDLIVDVGNLFNIYWRTDRKTKTVHAEPRDSFYNDLSTAENWTDRIYSNTQYELIYINNKYKKTNTFKYAEDDQDKWLNLRNEEVGDDWCSYKFDYPDKFKDGSTKIELKVLAATYHIEDVYCTNSVFAPFTARMWNTSTNQLPDVDYNFKPRLLYYNYAQQVYVYPDLVSQVIKTFTFGGVDKVIIPAALSVPVIIDGEIVADTGDANNVLSYKDVSGNDGLYYQHFSKTAGTIANGRILNINLLFDLVDYVDFDFRKPIYFDNRYQDIEGYWYVQKIKSFKPTDKQVYCGFELIEAFPFERYDTNGDSESGNDIKSQLFAARVSGAGKESAEAILGEEESINVGYDNRTPAYGGNIIVGNNLETDGVGVQRIGNNNVDVSTDLFQLSSNGVNIITQDEDGNILIMGRKQPTIESVVLDVSSDFTASSETLTYVVDTSSGDITATLPSSQNVGQTWNIKKISKDYKITIVTEGSELIDDKESLIIKSLSSARLQFDGTNYIII